MESVKKNKLSGRSRTPKTPCSSTRQLLRRTYLLYRGVGGAVVRVQLVQRVEGHDGGAVERFVGGPAVHGGDRGGGAGGRQHRQQEQQRRQQQQQRRRRCGCGCGRGRRRRGRGRRRRRCEWRRWCRWWWCADGHAAAAVATAAAARRLENNGGAGDDGLGGAVVGGDGGGDGGGGAKGSAVAVAGRSTMPARKAGGLQRAGSRVAGRRRRDHPRLFVGRDDRALTGHVGPTAGAGWGEGARGPGDDGVRPSGRLSIGRLSIGRD